MHYFMLRQKPPCVWYTDDDESEQLKKFHAFGTSRCEILLGGFLCILRDYVSMGCFHDDDSTGPRI